MPPPKAPLADPLTGDEWQLIVQNGKLTRAQIRALIAFARNGYTTDNLPEGQEHLYFTSERALLALKAALEQKADKSARLRVARFSGTTNASGIAIIAFNPAFDAIPDIDVIEAWSSDQMVTGAVVAGSATKSGCQVQVMLSRATLLLSTGPFQKAAAGVSVTVRAIGN
jgi:hypothetical protein